MSHAADTDAASAAAKSVGSDEGVPSVQATSTSCVSSSSSAAAAAVQIEMTEVTDEIDAGQQEQGQGQDSEALFDRIAEERLSGKRRPIKTTSIGDASLSKVPLRRPSVEEKTVRPSPLDAASFSENSDAEEGGEAASIHIAWDSIAREEGGGKEPGPVQGKEDHDTTSMTSLEEAEALAREVVLRLVVQAAERAEARLEAVRTVEAKDTNGDGNDEITDGKEAVITKSGGRRSSRVKKRSSRIQEAKKEANERESSQETSNDAQAGNGTDAKKMPSSNGKDLPHVKGNEVQDSSSQDNAQDSIPEESTSKLKPKHRLSGDSKNTTPKGSKRSSLVTKKAVHKEAATAKQVTPDVSQKPSADAAPSQSRRRSARAAASKKESISEDVDTTLDEEDLVDDINDIADFIRQNAHEEVEKAEVTESGESERVAEATKETEDKVTGKGEEKEGTSSDGKEMRNISKKSSSRENPRDALPRREVKEAVQTEELEESDKGAATKRDNAKRRRKSSTEKKSAGKKAKRTASIADSAQTGGESNETTAGARASSGSGGGRSFKPVQNWRKAVRLPSSSSSFVSFGDKLDSEQIFPSSVLSTYIPCVPPGTSQRLIEHLTETDVDLLVCPGCRDRFVLPTTFFQHIYRKSVDISFSCQACEEVLTFNNRCHLKIHILSHMERDGVSSVAANFLKVSPVQAEALDTGYRDPEQTAILDSLHEDLNRHDPDLKQCSECHLSMSAERLRAHFQNGKKGESLQCERADCGMALATRCSAAAHKRAHDKASPHTCPECGGVWETWRAFSAHAQDGCHHDARVLALACRVCQAAGCVGASAVIDEADILSHMYASHVKLYYMCSSCPKAFDNKAAIYAHRDGAHEAESQSDETSLRKSIFHLLYKAPFLRGPDNLFSSREAFEAKVHRLARGWERFFAFKCSSCESHFADTAQLARHNRRWCRMQNWCCGSPSQAASSVMGPDGKTFSPLFATPESEETLREKKKAVAEAMESLRSALGSDCRSSLLKDFHKRIVRELEENLTPSKVAQDRSPSKGGRGMSGDESFSEGGGGESELDAPVNNRRATLRAVRTNSKDAAAEPPKPPPSIRNPPRTSEQSARSDSPLATPIPTDNGKAVKAEALPVETPPPSSLSRSASKSDLKKKAGRGPKGKAAAAREAQPFVESLGVGVPSIRQLLSFNNLGRRAHLLGSSVVRDDEGKAGGVAAARKARKRRKGARETGQEGSGGADSPLGVAEEDNLRMDSFHCGLCDFSTDLRDSFLCHILVHRPREPARPGVDFFQCRQCAMCFASEPAWKKHLFLLHGVRRPEAEDYCEDVLAAAKASKDFEVDEEGESGSGFLAVEDEMLAEYEEEAEQERARRSREAQYDFDDEDEVDPPLTIDEDGESESEEDEDSEEEEDEESEKEEERRRAKKRKKSGQLQGRSAPPPPPAAGRGSGGGRGRGSARKRRGGGAAAAAARRPLAAASATGGHRESGASAPTANKHVCAVCNRSFSTPPELRRHFRGHGMAYLSYMHSSPSSLNSRGQQ